MNAIDFNNLKEIPNIESSECFFCGPKNPYGLNMKFYTDSEKGYTRVTIPAHLSGWNNIVHGGIVTAVIDEIMCWTSSYLLKKLVLTKSLKIDFIRPILTTKEISAVAEISKNNNDKEIILKGQIFNKKGELCARGTGTVSAFSLDEAKKTNFLDQVTIDEIENFMFNNQD